MPLERDGTVTTTVVPMMHDVDESLRALIREEALAGTDVEVLLDAPTTEWSARRNSPTVDIYLYDVREDLRRRETGLIDVFDGEGRVTERVHPPRYYKLSYLVTAWTQRPEDEHRLLSAILACFVRHDRIPPERLTGVLEGTRFPVATTIALPPPEDRALSDVWSALGGELKPSLDLVVTAPLDLDRHEAAGPPVLEPVVLGVTAAGSREVFHPQSTQQAREQRATARRAPQGGRFMEALYGGSTAEGKPGRTLRIYNLNEEPDES